MEVLHFYNTLGISPTALAGTKLKIQRSYPDIDFNISSEFCYNVEVCNKLSEDDKQKLVWLVADYFNEKHTSLSTSLGDDQKPTLVLEFGPRLNFATAFSTNAVAICKRIGLFAVQRIEVSRRFSFNVVGSVDDSELKTFKNNVARLLYDEMTEMQYVEPLRSFAVNKACEKVYEIDVMKHGKDPLVEANSTLGLAFDETDIDYYFDLFANKLQRNPTNVECFDLAQSNSEHSRHWFFKGRMIIDGMEMEKCLMELICDTQKTTNSNNVIKFSDNSSAIEGYPISTLIPRNVSTCSMFKKTNRKRHITLTAETHNFPTGVAPFPGASTGTGGRIRDGHAAGRGSHVVAGTAGYCFGNLHIPGYSLPWEEASEYPSNFALPLDICIEASNGASDYGNKFGEPVITGFSRSFGVVIDGCDERREWIKPIMFSGGIGTIEDEHILKEKPCKGMKVAKVGGPVYRIGVGGGAASSVQVQGDNAEELDFGAVQRGDPEMEQKLNRLIRACIELGEKNPICSIHDQGAGGNGNVLKEICEPAGAVIDSTKFDLGDPTLSLLEIWGAEYQESDAMLVDEKDVDVIKKIAHREKVSVCFVGDITEDGSIKFGSTGEKTIEDGEKYAVDLPLDIVLGKMPSKTYNLERTTTVLPPLQLPQSLSILEALDRVLRLPSVASKQFLTNKVDRSVTGLIAQQQCVGPLQLPLADVAVVALSHFDFVGAATAIGEQPIKMLVDPKRGARCSVAEAFTNLVFANISSLHDVKCSGNWMWPAKLKGEGAKIYDACTAMCDMLGEIGAAVDGGKDSLSMAGRVDNVVVKSPPALVISVYAPCPDIRKKITPDLKQPGNRVVYVKMNNNSEWRLGGSALAQVFNQIGNEVPDIADVSMFSKCFNITQKLLDDGLLLSGHDVSDGGLITCLLEMAFAGNCGIDVDIGSLGEELEDSLVKSVLFSEEPAIILEVEAKHVETVLSTYREHNALCVDMGAVQSTCDVRLRSSRCVIYEGDMKQLRSVWQETSFQLERYQCNPACVSEEHIDFNNRHTPKNSLSFATGFTLQDKKNRSIKVAIIREEGSNGDREMASAFHIAGFDVYDITMHDIVENDVDLDEFNGIAFVGGFSFADVFGSAKGWASLSTFNADISRKLERFRCRVDTFSLGVCNGCQLMSLLGWVGDSSEMQLQDNNTDTAPTTTTTKPGVRFTTNTSERFESRFVNVKILDSPSIMLRGMEESHLGIWVAHGEGRMECKDDVMLEFVQNNALAPIRYTDDDGNTTLQYPLNPNGSPLGVAALCSKDGRHLAMMPHPERCFMKWQLPWCPPEWNSDAAPWLKMFENAYNWCVQFHC